MEEREAKNVKRVGNLWNEVVSWDNLLASALAAAGGKKSRANVAQFLFRLEPNLCELQRELQAAGTRREVIARFGFTIQRRG